MEIKQTNNYDLFKFRKENRIINYNKVYTLKNSLMESRKTNNSNNL